MSSRGSRVGMPALRNPLGGSRTGAVLDVRTRRHGGGGADRLLLASRRLPWLCAWIVIIAAWVICPAPPMFADDQDENSTPMPPPVTTTVMATPTPAPAMVSSTGGNVTGSYPGTGCAARLLVRAVPPAQSALNAWATNGDAGWSLGWESPPPYQPSLTAPIVGCSR